MGWANRSYSSGPGGPVQGGGGLGFGLPAPTRMVKYLLFANFAVFVLVALTGQERGFLFRYGCMNVDAVTHGQIWRLITYQFLHSTNDIMHILFNMLGLYFLGPPLERHWGPKRFFAFYTVGGVLGSVFYVLLVGMGVLQDGIMVGASGCVLSILGACAVLFPQFQIILLFFPVPIRFAALLFSGIYALNILSKGPNAGGDAAHLAGLAYGVLWPLYGQRFWSNYRAARQHTTYERKQHTERSERNEMDRILRKVHEKGVNSLTGREKQFLSDTTRRNRDEDRKTGLYERR